MYVILLRTGNVGGIKDLRNSSLVEKIRAEDGGE